jgi:hypothetical protein
MNALLRKRNGLVLDWLIVVGVLFVSLTSPSAHWTLAQGNANDTKRVKIAGSAVELIELRPSAPECGKQKGETVRLRVTSETQVEVRLYIQTGYKRWMDKDFSNQKRGDEITSYRCDQKPNYKIFSRAVGSSEAWPKP